MADDDQLDAVAARFGLTADEVLSLDPWTMSDTMPLADATLDLDPNGP